MSLPERLQFGHPRVQVLRARIAELETELKEERATRELILSASDRALAAWRAEDPEHREGVIPDLAGHVAWALRRVPELERKLAEAEAVQAEAAEMAESALSVLDGDGELALVGGYLGDIAALNDSPATQALAQLVEAGRKLLEARRRQSRDLTAEWSAFGSAHVALQAARSGRGEGE